MTIPLPSRSLTLRTLLHVAIRITLVVIVASVIGYYHVSQSLQTQTLDRLAEYMQQRGMRESSIFLLARDNLRTFAEAYDERLALSIATDWSGQFAELFEILPDGSIRLKEAIYQASNITGYIGKLVAVDTDLQHHLVLGYELLNQFGPAWINRFVNLYVTTPENAVLMYWPGKPWGLNVNEWQINAKLALTVANSNEVITNTRPQMGEPNWSGLYFDYAVNDWLVSATEPVNRNGEQILAVGLDIPLHDLIERTVSEQITGTYNLIFRADGLLIAHPRFMDALQASSGQLTIAEANDANLDNIYQQVTRAQFESSAIIENAANREYLAVIRLRGPDWYLVTVFPKSLIAAQALDTAQLILILGAAALFLEIMILLMVLRKQLARPLLELMRATRRIAAGDFNIQLDDSRRDEIGRLASALNIMSRGLQSREKALKERSATLSQLNQRLEQELTEREQIQQQVVQQREALHQSEKMNALGSMLAGVAHELNNPLSVVIGRAMMLEDQFKDKPQAASVGKIRAAAERCARIVKTFLSMARQQEPVFQTVTLAELIDTSLELVGYGLAADGIEVEIDLPDDLPDLCCDADQVVQVFTNLFINAQQAMPTLEKRKIMVTAQAEPAEQKLMITVADSGPGIPADALPRIFEPFFTTKEIGKGTGLGLSVSHGIIQAHGGTISARNSSTGAIFKIELPCEASSYACAETVSTTARPSSGQRILVIDDEQDVSELLRDILAGVGYQVSTVDNGRAALALLGKQAFDLILCDMRMPDVDGQGFYEALNETQPALCQRLIFITGDILNEVIKAFLEQVKRPVIEKPFIPDDIRDIVAHELSIG